jgi:PncC family amidohydrolase
MQKSGVRHRAQEKGKRMNDVPQDGTTGAPEPLEEVVGRLLREKGLTLALAESCTGGLVGHRITEVPGSSDYFSGGIVAYADAIKAQLLGVRRDTLTRHGAVSAETALEMARGARRALQADIGMSITGIAGPGGATPEKPVGLVYIGLSTRSGERYERHVWGRDRSGNKALSAEAVLALLRGYLEENK